MENKAAKKKNSLRHRFAQILLGSSCTSNATTNGNKYSGFRPVNLSSPAHQPQEPPEVHSDCGIDKPQQKERRRRKLDKSAAADWFAPRVPVIQVSIDCGARHSIHSYEPFLISTPNVEKSDKSKEKRPTALYEAIKKEQKRLPPALLSACSRNVSSSYSYRGGGEEAKNKKKISNRNRDKGRRKETMRLLSNAYGFSSSSSSCDSGTERGLYSNDDEDDEEESAGTLFSSRSFSSDSSEFYRSKRKNNAGNDKKKKNRSTSMKSTRRPARPPNTRRAPRRHKDHSDSSDKFRPLVSYSSSSSTQKAETKEAMAKAETADAEKPEGADGFAVVKSSSDPYMDFRVSMVEMIVERDIKSAKDMEGLLHSYLRLNSAHHHPVILEAFKDIWEAVFCCLD